MILKKIYAELVLIRKELHNIRNAMEFKKTDTDAIAYDIGKKLEKAFSAMNQ